MYRQMLGTVLDWRRGVSTFMAHEAAQVLATDDHALPNDVRLAAASFDWGSFAAEWRILIDTELSQKDFALAQLGQRPVPTQPGNSESGNDRPQLHSGGWNPGGPPLKPLTPIETPGSPPERRRTTGPTQQAEPSRSAAEAEATQPLTMPESSPKSTVAPAGFTARPSATAASSDAAVARLAQRIHAANAAAQQEFRNYALPDECQARNLYTLLVRHRLLGLWPSAVDRYALAHRAWRFLPAYADAWPGMRGIHGIQPFVPYPRMPLQQLGIANMTSAALMAYRAFQRLPFTSLYPSGEMFRAYLPNPRLYRTLFTSQHPCKKRLVGKPLMVSARLNELVLAKAAGFRVAYVSREGEEIWHSIRAEAAKQAGWVDYWVVSDDSEKEKLRKREEELANDSDVVSPSNGEDQEEKEMQEQGRVAAEPGKVDYSKIGVGKLYTMINDDFQWLQLEESMLAHAIASNKRRLDARRDAESQSNSRHNGDRTGSDESQKGDGSGKPPGSDGDEIGMTEIL